MAINNTEDFKVVKMISHHTNDADYVSNYQIEHDEKCSQKIIIDHCTFFPEEDHATTKYNTLCES